MKIENPKVTLADEARNGVKEEVRSGFLDWLMEFNVEGDDGELYALGGSILSLALEKMDLVNLCYAKGKGSVNQLRNSVYKLAKYPGTVMNKFYRNPQGTLQIERREHSVLVTCTEHYKVECFDNGIGILFSIPATVSTRQTFMKDYSIYDLENDKHYTSNGDLKGGDRDRTEMEITHEDWAFMRELDGFVPTYYNVRIKTEDGVYEVRAHVCNARVWGVTFQVPDNPVATPIFDKVEGTFTHNDGTVRTLTGGRGTMSVRQWHQYPNMLPRELYCDDELTGEKFETL